MNCLSSLDRRGFLRGTAALGALVAFGGYALNGTGAALADSADASASSRIVIGRPTDADNLDPVTCIGNQNIFLFNLILDGLVKTSDDGESIEPCLATEWEVSEDGTTYTFNVQEGLLFADGSPVTAAGPGCVGIPCSRNAVAGAGTGSSPWAQRTVPRPVLTGEAQIYAGASCSSSIQQPTTSPMASSAPTS